MLEEITEEELLGLSLLGEFSVGLIVELKEGRCIFENLIVKDSKCFYYHQEDDSIDTWCPTLSASEAIKRILGLIHQVVPDSWKSIRKIYLINEE